MTHAAARRRFGRRTSATSVLVTALTAALVAGGLAACDPPSSGTEATASASARTAGPPAPRPSAGTATQGAVEETTAPSPGPSSASDGSALAAVSELTVKGRAPRTGYSRDAFGPAWKDVDRNGCDTRNDILARDLVDETLRAGTNDCVVETGLLHEPYSGTDIDFVRGQDTSADVQIDHVVALSDAWQKGAQQWDLARRESFANDPLNLLAVDGTLNMQKGDGDTATWLPPNRAYRCPYVARQVGVKLTYGVWVTEAERDAMVRVLSTCPDEPLPAGSATAAPAPTEPAVAEPTEPGPEEPAAAVDGPFPNCAAAWEAGAAPVHRGDPGYSERLDRDGDGIGCESRP